MFEKVEISRAKVFNAFLYYIEHDTGLRNIVVRNDENFDRSHISWIGKEFELDLFKEKYNLGESTDNMHLFISDNISIQAFNELVEYIEGNIKHAYNKIIFSFSRMPLEHDPFSGPRVKSLIKISILP